MRSTASEKRKIIGIICVCCLFLLIGVPLSTYSSEPARVVVVPLESGPGAAAFVNVETSYTWSCPPSPISLSLNAECPAKCIAVGGGCSAKTVGDATDVVVTGANFFKTSEDVPKYNGYQCLLAAPSCSAPGGPPVGYAQVVCYCGN